MESHPYRDRKPADQDPSHTHGNEEPLQIFLLSLFPAYTVLMQGVVQSLVPLRLQSLPR